MKRPVLFLALGISMALLISSCGLHIRYVVRTSPAPGEVLVYRYWYYPSSEIYYDYTNRVYFYPSNGAWFRASRLPYGYSLGPSHVMVDVNSDRPYVDHEKHRLQYPPNRPMDKHNRRWDRGHGENQDSNQNQMGRDQKRMDTRPGQMTDHQATGQKGGPGSDNPSMGRGPSKAITQPDLLSGKRDRRNKETVGSATSPAAQDQGKSKAPPGAMDKGAKGNRDNVGSETPTTGQIKDKATSPPGGTMDKSARKNKDTSGSETPTPDQVKDKPTSPSGDTTDNSSKANKDNGGPAPSTGSQDQAATPSGDTTNKGSNGNKDNGGLLPPNGGQDQNKVTPP